MHMLEDRAKDFYDFLNAGPMTDEKAFYIFDNIDDIEFDSARVELSIRVVLNVLSDEEICKKYLVYDLARVAAWIVNEKIDWESFGFSDDLEDISLLTGVGEEQNIAKDKDAVAESIVHNLGRIKESCHTELSGDLIESAIGLTLYPEYADSYGEDIDWDETESRITREYSSQELVTVIRHLTEQYLSSDEAPRYVKTLA